VSNAQALTLSRPLVQSKQGEALRAEIDIIDLIPSEEVELQAGLATPEAYRAARMELPRSGGTPIDVIVQLQRRSDGRPFLKITSPQVVNTNFIDLLLVLQWATGRSLRDVSLSLEDGRANNTKPALPLLMPADLQNTAEKPTAKVPQPPMPVAAAVAKDDQRVGVQQGDTAGQIAKENLVSGASLDQMLLAMLRSNPNAFVDANVNRLKTGALLTLPSAQEATSVSREEARKAIQIQAEDFREYRARLAAAQLGGETPKASRASEGKLDAQVSTKAASSEDKLTLTKPGKDAPEEKVAKQLEVQDVASRASEISQNMADLSKLVAAATASSASNASEPAAVSANVVAPEAAQDADEDTLKAWMSHPLAPLGAGGLVSLMAIIGLWLSRGRRNTKEDAPEAVKPLNVNFDLDLPKFDNDLNPRQDPSHEDTVATPEPETQDKAETAQAPVASTPAQPAIRPTMTMPSVSLDLDLASVADPFQVRIDLAEELWKLGQHHTSRALMEEVMQESNGATQAKAKQWLADRA
jgi:pilus assembly protein FimV